MKNLNYLLIGLMLITFSIASFGQEGTYTLVIHGGAGNIARENISEERERMQRKYRRKARSLTNANCLVIYSM